MVAAAFAGERPTPGFEIEITGTRATARRWRSPSPSGLRAPGMMAAQMIVTPFHIVTLPRYDGEVRFVDGGPIPVPSPEP